MSDAPGVLADHRRTADRDFYWIYNSTAQRVQADLRLRVVGRPETWDPETGRIHPLYTFRIEPPYLVVTLELGPYEGRLLAVAPGGTGPRLASAPGLEEVRLVQEAGGLRVEGRTPVAGNRWLEAVWEGRSYRGELRIPELPAPVPLQGPWKFSVEPTLDNRWRDFRLPVTDQNRVIGPEVRRFLYRQEEDGEDGLRLGWTEADLDESGWEEAVYTVGPYWGVIPPFPTRGGPGFFQQSFIPETQIDPRDRYRFRDRVLKWEKYSFSQDFGIHRDPEHYRAFGAAKYIHVNPDFFDLGPIDSFSVAYAFTYVYAPEEGRALLETNAGSYMEAVRVWVNDEVVSDRYLVGPIGQMLVSLKEGWNRILVKVMQYPMQGPKRMRFYVRLTPESEILRPSFSGGGSGKPRLPGFPPDSPFVYDVEPERNKRVGWYRFPLPPGTSSLQLELFGRARAFVGGEEVPVSTGGEVRLQAPSSEGEICVLRVEQDPGRYAGAVFRAPIRLEITQGDIRLGDWSGKGLESYSGVGVYSTQFRIPAGEEVGWVLDLGTVHTSADVQVNGRPAGARAWSPYRLDITPFLREGLSTVEIRVANTLANHGLTGTAWMFIYEETERSGLIGPVVLRPYRRFSARLEESPPRAGFLPSRGLPRSEEGRNRGGSQ